MKRQKLSNKFDYGSLSIANQEISDSSFEVSGLSLGFEQRAVFEDCRFSNIRIKKCSVGFPVFKRCHFENIIADAGNGVLVYGAALSECVFSGALRNVVLGFMCEHVPMHPDKKPKARRFQEENIQIATNSAFAIDLTRAELVSVAIRGEEIVPFVRCARNQAVILEGEDLFEKLEKLGLGEPNRAKSDFFLGTGAMPGDRIAIGIMDKRALKFLGEMEFQLKGVGLEVRHFE
jgi:hypothetical protein